MVEINAEKDPMIKMHTLNFTQKEAAMLLEMTTQTAAKGPDAATLASLHAMAIEATDALK
jgi:hypothetical protein